MTESAKDSGHCPENICDINVAIRRESGATIDSTFATPKLLSFAIL